MTILSSPRQGVHFKTSDKAQAHVSFTLSPVGLYLRVTTLSVPYTIYLGHDSQKQQPECSAPQPLLVTTRSNIHNKIPRMLGNLPQRSHVFTSLSRKNNSTKTNKDISTTSRTTVIEQMISWLVPPSSERKSHTTYNIIRKILVRPLLSPRTSPYATRWLLPTTYTEPLPSTRATSSTYNSSPPHQSTFPSTSGPPPSQPQAKEGRANPPTLPLRPPSCLPSSFTSSLFPLLVCDRRSPF